MKQYFLIMNPGSKSGRSKTLFSTIHNFFNENKLEYDYEVTTTLEDAENISKKASRKGYRKIVAVGGDGTINRVLNGLYDNGKRNSSARFGVIYTGTSPDFCKSFNIPVNVEQSLLTLKRGYETEITPGFIRFAKNHTTNSSERNSHDSVFACCANIGIGADLAEAANSGIRGVIGDFAGTFISLLKTLITFKSKSVTTKINNSEQKIRNLYNLSVGKTHHVASGIKIKNDLSFTDRRFYMLTVKDLTLFQIPNCLKSLYGGKQITDSSIFEYTYLENIEITGSNKPCRVEFDGDPAGYLPCKISTANDSLKLITDS
ncbi:MAG: diacylglycerol kinase [Desulfobacterales bacterium]|nr:diacylglycerol kinase [Desulfobacterales bacterium]MCP4161849.1 diacylglycerol kinase [Deltaproteobacteria bacterium]